ncbi:Neuroblast differentiation-associated protein AHNAK [Oryzias melastigma]|uniref:Neuroblast differentiation-associated protein AHNAK n=1 Tax=Oryzias melastigma TaxID=30732 RepID=A0A834C1V7_ORYME|nr:Neuroblast differentiation-associated protein AHNAK [Oryzias melastigma]
MSSRDGCLHLTRRGGGSTCLTLILQPARHRTSSAAAVAIPAAIMCDCFHLAFPNWHAASSGAGRRLRGPEAAARDDSVSEESSQLVEEERPRPQGSSPVEEFPEAAKYIDTETEAERDLHHKSGHKTKRTGLGSMFERRTTPKMSKLKEVPSPEGGVIVRTPKGGCAEGLVYSGGGKEGIFIKEVVPESPASKSLTVKEGDQILSATVYFDNVPYEDAIQILEHAQAYKVKLCLKRKPDITEMEPGIESDVIPEEEISSADMREQGKTKRRGDARISWPKFPSFGKGRKSRFTRSHSSSEADEQRKLELSPTTSDTESPIKSQDALKGKKKHKIKLSGLKKRGRISSSEDTEAPTTAPISGDAQQAQESDMLSPESLEGIEAETAEGQKTEDLKMDEDTEQKIQRDPSLPQTVELISLESTLKTGDPTVPLADHKSPTEAKPADGKKKKKDRLELKMKILGKDRSHKKDAKAVSSPKRLKTLGASLEKDHQPEPEDSQQPNVEKHTTEETKIIEDPYEKLSKSAGSTAELPKREDIMIPGMEDMSMSTATGGAEPVRDDNEENHSEAVQLSIDVKSVKEAVSKLPGFKLPQVDMSGVPIPEEITVIDANAQRISVKTPTKVTETKAKQEAQQTTSDLKESSIPSVKETTDLPPEGLLGDTTGEDTEPQNQTKSQPKEDDSTQTIKREQITISWVDTPQKLSILHTDGTEKASGTTDVKTENDSAKESNQIRDSTTTMTHSFRTEAPDFRSSLTSQQSSARTDFSDIKTSEGSGIKASSWVDESTAKKDSSCQLFVEEKVSVEDEDMSVDGIEKKTFLRDGKGGRFKLPHLDISLPKVKGPKSDVGTSKKDVTITQAKAEIPEAFEADVTTSGTDIYIPEQKMEITTEMGACETQTEPGGNESRFKMPKLGIKIPKMKGSDTDVKPSKKDADAGVKVTSLKDEVRLPEADVVLEGNDTFLSEQTVDSETPEKQVKPPETKDESKGKSKKPMFGIKLTKMKGPDIDFSLTKKSTETAQETGEAQIPAASETSETKGTEKRTETDRAEVELQPPETDGELGVQAGKFKMPKLGIKMPKVKGPELDLSLQKKDIDVTQPEVEVKLAEVSGTDAPADVSMPDKKTEEPEIKAKQSDKEHDRHSSKFKMPRLVIAVPKVTESGLSRKDEDVKASDSKLQASAEEEAGAPKVTEKQAEGSKLKMPTFQMPKFTSGSSDASFKSKDSEIPDAELKSSEKSVVVCSETKEGSSPLVKTKAAGGDELSSKFKMPTFDISFPKLKGPEVDLSSQRKDKKADLPEAGSDSADIPIMRDREALDTTLHRDAADSPPTLRTTLETPKPQLDQSGISLDKEMRNVGADVLGEVSATCSEASSVKTTSEPEQDGKETKFKMPYLSFSMPKIKGSKSETTQSKRRADVTGPEDKRDVPEPEVERQKGEAAAAEVDSDWKTPEPPVLDTEGQLEKEKTRKFGLKMPKLKVPELQLGPSKTESTVAGESREDTALHDPKTDTDLPSNETKLALPEVSKTDVSLGKAEILMPEGRVEMEKVEVKVKTQQAHHELTGQGSRFKIPKLGITMPKVKEPEADSSISKDVDVTLEVAKTENKLPDTEPKEPSIHVGMKPPETQSSDVKQSPSKFKMPSFKLPRIGVTSQNISTEIPDSENVDEVNMSRSDPDVPATGELHLTEEEVEEQIDGEAGVKHKKTKFSMPKFSFSKPSVKPSDGLSLSIEEDETPEGRAEVKESSLSKTNVDITLPEAEVKLLDNELKTILAEVDTRTPEITVEAKVTEESSSSKMPILKLPKFGSLNLTSDKPTEEIEIKIQEPEIKVPKEVLSITMEAPSAEAPSFDTKRTESEQDGKGGKFKMPSLGFSAPKGKGPEVDVSLTKPEIDVTLEGVKEEVKAPGFQIQTKDKEGSPSRFKMPTFKLPKFGLGSAAVDVPADAKIQGPDANMEEVLSVTVEAPSLEIQTTESEQDGKGSKFKMPSLGFSGTKGKGPEVDVSLTKPEIDVSLRDTKLEVKVSDTEVEQSSIDVKTSSPEIKLVEKETKGSPSRFKMPTFKLPKFGVGSAAVDVPADAKIAGPDANMEEVLSVTIEAPSTEAPSLEIKTIETEKDGKGGKFKMPSLGFSAPKGKGPEVDVSLTKPEIDVTLEGVKEEVKAPEIQIKTKDKEGSPSRFKMPTFKLPKFGLGSAAVDVPAVDKDGKIEEPDIEVPEEVLSVTVEAPSLDIKTAESEQDGKGSKFKMPSLGFSGTKVKGPEVDVSLTKPEVDVPQKKAHAEVKLPDTKLEKPTLEVDIKDLEISGATKKKEESTSTFKMPTFKLPSFGVRGAAVDVPAVEKDVQLQQPDIKIPEEVLSVTIKAPSTEASVDIKTAESEQDGKGSKFKMPSLGFSAPKVKGPGVDVSLTKPEMDVSMQETKLEVKVSDTEVEKLSIDVKTSSPEIKLVEKETKGSPSRFKMPTFKLPKFGVGSAAVDVPAVDKDGKIEEPDIEVPEEVLSVTVEAPSLHLKTAESEQDGKGSKFKMPSLGFSAPKGKGPEVDVSLTKPEVDVPQKKAHAEVKLPDTKLEKPTIEVDIKDLEISGATKKKEESTSTFKMPTFKLPSFGVRGAAVDVPAVEKDVQLQQPDIKIPEEVLSVTIKAPSTEASVDIKTAESEQDGKGSKFKMPSLGFSAPKGKGPEVDVSLTKPEMDVSMQETKLEVKVSDTEVEKLSIDVKTSSPEIKLVEKETKGSPSRFKMPTFKLPKFGVGSAAVDVPAVDRDIKIEEPDIKVPEEVLSVTVEAPSLDIKTAESEQDGKGSKFKMPSLEFSGPKGKGPEVDVSLTKPEMDVSLRDTKLEVKVSDTEVEQSSIDVKTSSPEIKLVEKETKGSPSRFKMPTFKLPKFGVGSAAVDVPADAKIAGPDANMEEVLSVTVEAPSTEAPSLEIKTIETEKDGKGGKFKMPSLGFSAPKGKGPEVDVSLTKPEIDVTLEGVKEEVKAPEIQIETKDKEGSPSRFKMPTFKLPKFGLGSAAVDVPADAKIAGPDANMEEVLSVTVEAPSSEIQTTESEQDGKGGKFKMPSLGFSAHKVKGPEVDVSLTKPGIDVTLEGVKEEVKFPDSDSKKVSIEIGTKAPGIQIETKDTKGSPSRFKMPTFKLPKFGVGSAAVDVPADAKTAGPDANMEEVLSVTIEAPSLEIKTIETEKDGKGGKFKMPSLGFSAPKGKGPEVDVSLTKPEIDVTLEGVKEEVKAPEIQIETKDKEGSPSRFKMPTFKLPKFGLGSGAVDVPVVDKDGKLEEPDIEVPEEVLSVTVEAPSLDIKTAESEQDGKGSKFKMPSLGLSGTKGKGPEVDVSLTKPKVGDIQPVDTKLEVSLSEGDTKALDIKISEKDSEGSPSKFKMPSFSLPKFGSTPPALGKAPDLDKEVKLDVSGSNADVKPPDVETKDLSGSDVLETKGDVKERKASWTLPRFSFSKTSTKAPEADMDVQVGLSTVDTQTQKQVPEAIISTSVVEGPGADLDVKVKKTRFSLPKLSFSKQMSKESGEDVSLQTGEGKQPDIEVGSSDSKTEGYSTDSKLRKPTFGITMPKVKDVNISQKDVNIKVEVPDVDVKMIQPHATVEVKAPEIKAPADRNKETMDQEILSVDVKGSRPKTDVGVMLPEFKAEVESPHTEVKEHIDSSADVPTTEVDPKLKRPNWAFPKISFSRTVEKADAHTNRETSKVTTTESTEVCQSEAAVKGPHGPSAAEESSAVGPDMTFKKSKLSLPKISLSKSSSKEAQVMIQSPHDVLGPNVGADFEGPQTALQVSELEAADKRSPLKPEMFGIAQPKPEGSEINMNLDNSDAKEVELSQEKVKDHSVGADTVEDKPKDARGSPLKFKMPALKLPKFGSGSHHATSDAERAEKVTRTDITKLKEDDGVPVKPASADATDDPKAAGSDADAPRSGTDAPSHGSPSKFKLPSFKMPKLSLSRPKPEEEHGPVDDRLEDQLEVKVEDKGESQTSKVTLTSFGELFKTTDVEFDVLNKAEKSLETSREIPETEKASIKPSEGKENETKSKPDTPQSPEKAGWFKLPKIGLSLQSEPPGVSERDQKGDRTPPRETGEDETSPTSSLHSSDAFADVSSTFTSEHVGASVSSPTKVTVKYFDHTVSVGPEERTGDIFTSTTKTELISDVPDLPEKVTIPSSGVTSSSEDTLRLDPGKIHAITSNIQATPEAQHAKLLTAVQMQPAEDDPVKCDTAVSWDTEDPLSGRRTVFESSEVWEASGERSQTTETVVITKQVTSIFDTTEPISGETASSIQRLKHTMHLEKMRFFDEGEK